MNNDDVTLLSAYLDDELSPEQRLDVENRLASDDQFAALFNELDNIDHAIESKYSAIDEKPLPSDIERLLTTTNTDNVSKIETAKSPSFVRRYLPMAAAVACVAIMLPFYMTNVDDFSNQIADALNTVPSGEEVALTDNAVMTIQMSFENNDAQLCREYIFRDNKASNSAQQIISCKVSNSWQQIIMADVTMNPQGGYQPASAQTNTAIETWLDNNMASDAYSLSKEKEVLTK